MDLNRLNPVGLPCAFISSKGLVARPLGLGPNGKRANGKNFVPVTSDVWTLIRSIKYSLIKKLIT
jgi:hypothetical protein